MPILTPKSRSGNSPYRARSPRLRCGYLYLYGQVFRPIPRCSCHLSPARASSPHRRRVPNLPPKSRSGNSSYRARSPRLRCGYLYLYGQVFDLSPAAPATCPACASSPHCRLQVAEATVACRFSGVGVLDLCARMRSSHSASILKSSIARVSGCRFQVSMRWSRWRPTFAFNTASDETNGSLLRGDALRFEWRYSQHVVREVEEGAHLRSRRHPLARARLDDQDDVAVALSPVSQRQFTQGMWIDVGDYLSANRDPSLLTPVLPAHTARISVSNAHVAAIANGVRKALAYQLSHLRPSHVLRIQAPPQACRVIRRRFANIGLRRQPQGHPDPYGQVFRPVPRCSGHLSPACASTYRRRVPNSDLSPLLPTPVPRRCFNSSPSRAQF